MKTIAVVEDKRDNRCSCGRFSETATSSRGPDRARCIFSAPLRRILIVDDTPDARDLVMPNLDGIAVIKRVNEREPYRNIPVIVVTAKSALAVLRKGARLEEGLGEALQGIL